jgi:hypothetical protein
MGLFSRKAKVAASDSEMPQSKGMFAAFLLKKKRPTKNDEEIEAIADLQISDPNGVFADTVEAQAFTKSELKKAGRGKAKKVAKAKKVHKPLKVDDVVFRVVQKGVFDRGFYQILADGLTPAISFPKKALLVSFIPEDGYVAWPLDIDRSPKQAQMLALDSSRGSDKPLFVAPVDSEFIYFTDRQEAVAEAEQTLSGIALLEHIARSQYKDGPVYVGVQLGSDDSNMFLHFSVNPSSTQEKLRYEFVSNVSDLHLSLDAFRENAGLPDDAQAIQLSWNEFSDAARLAHSSYYPHVASVGGIRNHIWLSGVAAISVGLACASGAYFFLNSMAETDARQAVDRLTGEVKSETKVVADMASKVAISLPRSTAKAPLDLIERASKLAINGGTVRIDGKSAGDGAKFLLSIPLWKAQTGTSLTVKLSVEQIKELLAPELGSSCKLEKTVMNGALDEVGIVVACGSIRPRAK